MRILAIETSCDETSASVVERGGNQKEIKVLSNVTATSLSIHAKTGGIIPENAAREQVKFLIPVINESLLQAKGIKRNSRKSDFQISTNILKNEIDAIAVTSGPGLIGSLLVGVETAKTLSFIFEKPIIPVNHLLAHIFANFIEPESDIPFPFIGLIVSGGHTDLLYFKSFNKFKWLGGTRDDAAGEALDKIGRLLNLPYPAGPEIEKRASKIQETSIKFKSPIMGSDDFDFSFSGLKAETARFIEKEKKINEKTKNEICFAVQKAIIDVLVKKTVRAAKLYNCNTILLGGGVSANKKLTEVFRSEIKKNKYSIQVITPEKIYSTDNAAMIGTYAALNYKPTGWEKINANPDLYFV